MSKYLLDCITLDFEPHPKHRVTFREKLALIFKKR
jgi:hypothetical protein